MRAVVQRVTHASVTVNDKIIGAISRGLVILVGVTHADTETDARWLAQKIATLRIFQDDAGKFNFSALDLGAPVLVVPQFTLYADTRRGRRPDFIAAAKPEIAEPLIEKFAEYVRTQGLHVETGEFQAHMLVQIFNDGPVTIILDSREKTVGSSA